MIRLSLAQLQMAVACAQEVHSVERARDALPAGDMLDAVTTRTAANPLGSPVAVRVPRAVVVDTLNRQRDTSMAQLREMGIELDPGTTEADLAPPVLPREIQSFDPDISLVALRRRQRELRELNVRPEGPDGVYWASVPRSMACDRDEIAGILADKVPGFVPYWHYGRWVPEANEVGAVEMWRIVVRD